MATDSDGQGITDSRGMIAEESEGEDVIDTREEDREFWHIQFDLWQRVIIWIVIPFVILQTTIPEVVWIWIILTIIIMFASNGYNKYTTIKRRYT